MTSSLVTDEQRALVQRLKAEEGFGVMTALNRLRNFNWDLEAARHGTDRKCRCGKTLYLLDINIMDASELRCECGKRYTLWHRTGEMTEGW